MSDEGRKRARESSDSSEPESKWETTNPEARYEYALESVIQFKTIWKKLQTSNRWRPFCAQVAALFEKEMKCAGEYEFVEAIVEGFLDTTWDVNECQIALDISEQYE